MYDVIIIGSGPAGLVAAIYGERAGMNLAVIDKSPISGGQVLTTYEVDNYLGMPGINGSDMSDKFREHADKLEVPFITAEVERIEDRQEYKIIHTDEGDYETKTIIFATGASHAALGVKGENELAGMGVSYCATCDGAFFKKRDVAVVGGGDVAVEDAIFLAGICNKVYLIHRRDSLRAAESLQKKLLSMENVEILWNSEVKEINGNDMVESISIYNNKEEKTDKLPVNGVFIAVGIIPNTKLIEGLVKLDENGYVVAGEDCRTSASGIFAAGDVRKKALRQIITAVADGANAINSIQNYI